jgi:transcription antitermination factor NusG
MQSFIIATNTHDENVIRLDGRSYTFKSDDEVEVMAGKFKGVRGKVIRAGRQQRILIELSGFMTFATAYVPTDFVRKI